MTIRKTAATVGTLAQGAVSTAVDAARHPIGTASTAVGLAKHPIGTASMAVGLAKGVAGAGLDLVRGGRTDVQGDEATFSPTPVPETITETLPVEDDPRDDLPGPDLAQFEPPLPGGPARADRDRGRRRPATAGESRSTTSPSRRAARWRTAARARTSRRREGFVEEIPEDLRTE